MSSSSGLAINDSRREGYGNAEIPLSVQYTSPALAPPNGPSPTANLPLNLLALIISHLDDIGDVARVTRTSRLLYYMTLPQLYQKVSLHSYADIRYVNGRPEGYGGGSPFVMALNGLVTKNNGGLVREFRLWGEWDEMGLHDFAKGRVPDNTMMLSILLRTAVDKMVRLHSFAWELSCKPMKTLYQGLAARDTLTSLTLRFPSTRVPRPTTLIPPMSNLRTLKVMDIDPLCYPDDISLLLLHSRKLEDLRLHFSPRIRQHAEPTLSLDRILGRCLEANYSLRLKHVALQNFFGSSVNLLERIFNDSAYSMAFLDTFGGARGGSANVFLDDIWKEVSQGVKHRFRTIRFNEPAPQHVQMILNAEVGIENFYFVNDSSSTRSISGTPASIMTPETSPSEQNREIIALGKDYLHALTRKHGSSLRHLLLCQHWTLDQKELGDLVRLCPNLEQLAIALDGPAIEIFRILFPFLRNLTAIRVFDNDFVRQRKQPTEELQVLDIGRDLMKLDTGQIRYLGASDEIYRLEGVKQITNEYGTVEYIREVIPVPREEAQHIAIWGKDRLNIMTEAMPKG